MNDSLDALDVHMSDVNEKLSAGSITAKALALYVLNICANIVSEKYHLGGRQYFGCK